MDKATRKCPYCGGEILSVAKKCKHCGEWIEHPVENSAKGFFKDADFGQMLPVTSILFGINLWVNILLLFLIIGGLYVDGAVLFWGISLVLPILTLWIGLKSSSFLSSGKGVATLRTWFAMQIALNWWPGIILGHFLGGSWIFITWLLLIAVGIYVWIKYKRADDLTINDVAKPFTYGVLTDTCLTTLALYILFIYFPYCFFH